MKQTTIIKRGKMYSARGAFQLLPQVPNEPAMRKFIEEDLEGKNELETIVVCKGEGERRQFFIRGEKIAEQLPSDLVQLV